MKVLKINCGNFSSLDNFYQNIGLSLLDKGDNPIYDKIEFDCSLFNRNKTIRISVLTSLLALAYELKLIYKKPCHILLGEDRSLFQFFIED